MPAEAARAQDAQGATGGVEQRTPVGKISALLSGSASEVVRPFSKSYDATI